jgi:hypothetical protein
MTELEQALVALGRELEFPPTPDVAGAVRERLAPRRAWRRPLVFALAAVVVAFGIAMAVPPARSAILDFFHIGSVTVERVETLPPARERPLVSGLGPALSRPTLQLPRGLHATRYYKRPGLAAALLRVDGKPVLLAEMSGEQVSLTKKLAGEATRVEGVDLGEFGLWMEGAPHVLLWNFKNFNEARTRLAGNVLIWLVGDTTYRLEGDLDKGQMLELARKITP